MNNNKDFNVPCDAPFIYNKSINTLTSIGLRPDQRQGALDRPVFIGYKTKRRGTLRMFAKANGTSTVRGMFHVELYTNNKNKYIYRHTRTNKLLLYLQSIQQSLCETNHSEELEGNNYTNSFIITSGKHATTCVCLEAILSIQFKNTKHKFHETGNSRLLRQNTYY